MKKLIISSIIFFSVILIYVLVPIPVANAKIHQEQNAMHNFIIYEQQFLALNQKNLSLRQRSVNKQEDDRYQIQDLSRTTLLLNFERATYVLNKTLQQLQKQYPFLAPTIQKFKHWQSGVEKPLLQGQHLLYRQAPLLSYQLQMMNLINKQSAEEDWYIEKQVTRYQEKVSKLTKQQRCQILSRFGKTQSPELMSEQLAILKNHPPIC